MINPLDLGLNASASAGEYVVTIFEDSKKRIWFGTLGKRLALFDGKEFRYYTEENGLPYNHVVSIEEDRNGNFWIRCSGGLFKLENKTIINCPVGYFLT